MSTSHYLTVPCLHCVFTFLSLSPCLFSFSLSLSFSLFSRSLSDLTFLHESCKSFHGELVNFEKMVSVRSAIDRIAKEMHVFSIRHNQRDSLVNQLPPSPPLIFLTTVLLHITTRVSSLFQHKVAEMVRSIRRYRSSQLGKH